MYRRYTICHSQIVYTAFNLHSHCVQRYDRHYISDAIKSKFHRVTHKFTIYTLMLLRDNDLHLSVDGMTQTRHKLTIERSSHLTSP